MRQRRRLQRFGEFRLRPYGAVDSESVTLLGQALERLPPEDGPLRARVTGLLAVFEPEQGRREALIDEALAMARRLGDEATLGWLYPAAVIVELAARSARGSAREAAEEVVRAAAHHADHGALVWAYLHRIHDALQDGDIARADADLDRARPVAHATRRSFYRWHLMVAEAGRAAFAGRLEEAERMTEEALALNRRHGEDCLQEYTVRGSCSRGCAGARRTPTPRSCAGSPRAIRTCRCGRRCSPRWSGSSATSRRRAAASRCCARDDFAAVVRSPDFLPAARLPGRRDGRRGRAACRSSGSTSCWRRTPARTRCSSSCGRSGAPRRAGSALLAAADDRPRDAAAHFAEALRLADAWGAPGWALRTIGDWLATGIPVPDRGELVNRGLLLARELGLPGVAARIADEAQTITP